MTARRNATARTGLLGIAIVVAACGGTGPTTAPATTTTTPPPATQLPPTQAPPSFALPSLALPSLNPDVELEALYPDEIAGQAVQVVSMSGNDFMSTAGSQLAPVLQQLGKSPSDLSAAFGGTKDVSIIALKIKGVPAEQFLTAYTATAGAQGAQISDASFGGKAVKKVIPAPAEATVYLYLKDDVIWTIGGQALTDALLNETFSKLP